MLEGDVAREFLTAVLNQAREENLRSDEHFTVDGTLAAAVKERYTEPGNRELGVSLLGADGVERGWRTLILILGRDPGSRTGNARKPDLIERSRQRIRRILVDDAHYRFGWQSCQSCCR